LSFRSAFFAREICWFVGKKQIPRDGAALQNDKLPEVSDQIGIKLSSGAYHPPIPNIQTHVMQKNIVRKPLLTVPPRIP
jgi:hypothetical protein